MLIKKDRNKELEKILEHKKVDEQVKNLLQGILYKVEVSYKDYKIVKGKKQTEEKYVNEILENIKNNCDKINIGDEIIAYPIEEKILYAIEKKSNYAKILNNKYEEATIAISDLINSGKNMDRIEVLRDFNGWSWTTIKNEIENIEANLIYQALQIVLGEEFLDNWCKDKDGIIDYLEMFVEETNAEYKDLLVKIAIANTATKNKEFSQHILNKINQIDEEIKKYENTKEKIVQITNHKKQLLKELNKVEQILGQNARLKEYSIEQKIFNIKILKKQLSDKKQEILEQIEQDSYLLNPSNYINEKDKLIEKKEILKNAQLTQKQIEEALIKFIENFFKCFKKLIKDTNEEEEIVRLIYQFRYFMLLPFNLEKSIKDIKKLQKSITEIEIKLVQKAKNKKVITENVPFEVMKHVFETRIIILKDLYYKITKKSEKYSVQIFDDNISEEKFEMQATDKMKINKKIKIFI